MVAAKNNFETTEFNNSLCLLINNLEPLYRPSDDLYIANVSDGDILHSQNISFNDFDLRYWRGKRYYLVIVFAPEKADEESKQTNHIVSTKLFNKKVTDYWLKIKTKEFTINYEVDDYMKEGQSCNISHFKSYFQQSSSQFVLLNDLHPSTFYNLSAFACNEITCDLDNYLQSHFVTPEYKPARGPENISLTNSSSTSMVVSFGLIEEFYRHGEIVGYHVKLTCTSKTITRFINETNEITTSEFEGLKIYENCCIIIAGFTLYPAIGNYSQPVCNKTGEDLPTACPLNFKLSARSPTCLNFTWDIVDIKNQNGIIINYVATIMDGVSTQVVVTKDLFINFCNLKRFYEYTVMIQGRTSAGIGENCTIHNVTEEDVPCAPHNISTKAYFTDYIIVEWEDIPEICKNGIILEFVIFYYEVGNDNERIGDIQEKKITDVSLRKTHLKNINPGSKYNISVGGVTSKGLGDKTREITQRFGARVNGNWSEWSKWTPCSASCGLSISSRSRDCNDPIPKDGGSNCTGDDNELRECTEDPCSGYKLAPPGHYDCSIYCASLGMFCSKYVETDFEVVLKDLNIRCDRRDNPKWTEVKHPGMIKKDGLTSCVGFESYPNETKCSIEDDSHETSYQRICKCIHKSDIGFSPWVQWSVCTITCGDSQLRKRTRECSVSGECSGKNSQFSQCVGIPNCPIDGSWSDWTPFEPCNKTCGYGYRNRRRFCDNPVPLYNGQQCPGPKLHAIGECNTHYCPVHGNWNDWSRWSACKEPCGNSNQTRSRECNNPSPDFNGKDCVGNKTQSKGCSPQPPCIENTVHYIFEFTEKQFVYTMNYMHHPDTVKESNRLCQSHHDMVLNNTEINDCQVKTYRKGSVIVEMDVRYKYVNREQIIHVYDRINETKLFSNSKLGFFSVNSTTVSCPPPSNINVKELNGGKVEITYRVERCYDGRMPFQIYVFYIDDELHSQNDAWKWQGLFVTDKPNITIYDLVPMKKFRARLVASNNFGNGNPSHAIYFSSFAGPPLKSPPDLQFISLSSNTIYIDWSDVAVEYRNGQLLGYQVRFKYYLDDEYEEKVVSFGYKSITLEKLRPFTLYAIEVCAFNQGGNGPKDVAVVKTLEGVPSIPVPGVVINSYQAIDWWSISWKAIPDEHINGILLGYRLRYYLAYRSGLPIGGQKSYFVKDFDIFTFNHKENNLLSYATYNVTVTGFTTAGEGPSPELPAKTCHCPEHLFANWYINRPYVELNNEGKLIGIFPDLIKTTIIEACGKCFKYSKSQLYYYSTLSGANPNTGTELELKKRISDEVDVSFPLYGRKEIEAIVPDSVFISIISSPGCALIIRNETNIEGILNNMIMGVISVWPMLLVSYAIATLFGILVWFTDQTENPDEFNLGSSLRGPCIGFWFSFVTMTTIGYGDITPRSILAKSISMVWFLTGLVLNGIVVGFITSAVTSINIVEEHSLYNTMTGALNNSFEQRYSIMRNAKVPDEAFTTVDDVLDALSNSKVDAALIDIYSMASYKPILKKKQLKVVSLIDAKTGYGLALSGVAQVLKPDVESLVIEKQNIIGEFVSSLENSIPDLSQEQPGSASADIFSATSPAFITSCTYMGILILGLSFFGILFTTVQAIRKRMKVGVAKTQYDIILESSDLLLQFCEHIEEMVNEHTTKIDEELVELATYHWAYKHKIAKMGKEKVDRMINFSFDD